MPPAAAIIPVVAAIGAEYLAGAVIAEVAAGTLLATSAGTLTTVGTVAAGALGGAVGGAVGAAAQGQPIARGALFGAATGAVGSGLGEAAKAVGAQAGISEALQGAGVGPKTAGQIASGATKAGVSTLAGAIGGGIQGEGFITGAKRALPGAVLGGIGTATGLTGGGSEAPSVGERLATGAGQALVSSQLSQLFSPQRPSTQAGTGFESRVDTSPTSTQSALLGSGGPAYTGGPVFGTGADEEKRRQTGWNISSLRTKDEDYGAA